MKKLLFLLLGAVVAVSASAGVTKATTQKAYGVKTVDKSKVETVTRGHGQVAPTLQFDNWGKKTSHLLRSEAAITWDFEDSSQFNEFMVVDNDEDGFNWGYNNNNDSVMLLSPHSGTGLVYSESYHNDTYTALTPDNYLVSPEVTLGGALSLWARGQDASYAAEKFGVYVCVGEVTGPESFVQVGADITTTGEYVQYDFDLSAYQGQVGRFAIVHHNCTDQFMLIVDDITLDPEAVTLPYPVVPAVTVTPGVTSAMVNWGADEGADAYNLRWRPWTDMSNVQINQTFDFAYETLEEQLADVYTINADNDTLNWELYWTDSDHTDLCWGSESWKSGVGAFTPDNWLIMPEVKLEGSCQFTLMGSYQDFISVYALVGWDPSTEEAPAEEDLILLDSFTAPASSASLICTVDLASLDNQMGRIVFRHHNCYDQYRVYIDDIKFGIFPKEAEWNYENEISANSFNIEGLAPNTKYEVQVMGMNAEHASDWCDIVEFTTLGEEPVIPDVYMLGGDDQGWAPNRGIKFDYNAEDNIYTLNYTFPAETNYFGFTTVLAEYDDQGSWDYIEPYRFGAVADGENFIFFDEYNGQPLDLTWDAYKSFQIGAGEYDIVVDLTSMKVILTKVNVEPTYIRGDVDKSGEVKIGDVTALINYLLNGDASLVDLRAADCDLSGDVKIGDVTALINYLLNGEW